MMMSTKTTAAATKTTTAAASISRRGRMLFGTFVLGWIQLLLTIMTINGIFMMTTVTCQSTTTDDYSSSNSTSSSSSCYNNLTVIHLLNKVKDPFVHVTYTLCPNTIYKIGIEDEDEFIVTEPGFQQPIDLASNTKYQCGTSGQASNNCTLIGGIWQLYNTGISYGGIPTKNSSIHGLTFENAINNALFLGHRGDVVFYDCIFKNHKNFGTVAMAYLPPEPSSRRRLLFKDDHNNDEQHEQQQGVEYNMEYNINNNSSQIGTTPVTFSSSTLSLSNKDYIRLLQQQQQQHQQRRRDDRLLQSSSSDDNTNNDVDFRMKVTFDSCTFYNNTFGDDELESGIPGMMYVYFAYTDLIVLNTTFLYNNFYDSTNFYQQGYALFIEPGSSIVLNNTCYIQNQFRGYGTIQFNETIVYDLYNNYVDNRTSYGVDCSFVNTINNQTCIPFDAISCPNNTTNNNSIDFPPIPIPTIPPVAVAPSPATQPSSATTTPSTPSVPTIPTTTKTPVSTPTNGSGSSRNYRKSTTITTLVITIIVLMITCSTI